MLSFFKTLDELVSSPARREGDEDEAADWTTVASGSSLWYVMAIMSGVDELDQQR